MNQKTADTESSPLRAVVLHPWRQGHAGRDPEDALAEAINLAQALDLEIVASAQVPVQRMRAGTLFGTGKLDELADVIKSTEAGLVIVDGPVSPVQQRNLERAWKCKVLDRTGLILEIFGARARTREGVLQVELAHLNYQKSRLVRSWTHLERQRGGIGFLGGPGETQIEADRRALNDRIVRIKKSLAKVVKTRSQHRVARQRTPFPVVALVGYTNAGKSTLFNRLTGSSVMARDMLFATLDPTMRSLELPGGREIILSDTVGFIADLPTQLVAAFRATLEEVLEADIILHVRDISHPETGHQAENVISILGNLGLGESELAGVTEVWNKMDALDADEAAPLRTIADRSDQTLALSAKTGQGVDELLELLEARLSLSAKNEDIELRFNQGRMRAWLFEHNLVQQEKLTKTGYSLHVRWTQIDRDRYHAL